MLTLDKRLVSANAASQVTTHVVNLFVLVWLQQYLLARLPAEEYAVLPVVLAPMVLVPLLITVLTAGLGRYGVEALARGDARRVTEIASTMALLLLGAALLILGAGALLASCAGPLLAIPEARLGSARWMIMLLAGGAAFRVATQPFALGLFMRQRFKVESVLQLLTQALRLVLLFLLLSGAGPRVLWVVVSSTVAEVAGQIVRVFVSRAMVPELRFHRTHVTWERAREIAGFGRWAFLEQVANVIRKGSPHIVLGRCASAVDVTCFHLGSLLLFQVQLLMQIAVNTGMPALVTLHARKAHHALRLAYLRSARHGFWLALLIVLPLCILAEPLVRLYVGPQYSETAPTMQWLLWLLPLEFANLLMMPLARATGRLRGPALLELATQGTVLGVSLVLVGPLSMGARGAAVAALLVTLVFAPWAFALGHRLSGVDARAWWRESITPALWPALSGCLVWAAWGMLMPPDSWGRLVLCGLVGSAVFVVVLFTWSLRRLETSERPRPIDSAASLADPLE